IPRRAAAACLRGRFCAAGFLLAPQPIDVFARDGQDRMLDGDLARPDREPIDMAHALDVDVRKHELHPADVRALRRDLVADARLRLAARDRAQYDSAPPRQGHEGDAYAPEHELLSSPQTRSRVYQGLSALLTGASAARGKNQQAAEQKRRR